MYVCVSVCTYVHLRINSCRSQKMISISEAEAIENCDLPEENAGN